MLKGERSRASQQVQQCARVRGQESVHAASRGEQGDHHRQGLPGDGVRVPQGSQVIAGFIHFLFFRFLSGEK